MPKTIDDIEYLSTRECYDLLHMTQYRFVKFCRKHDIKSYYIMGEGRAVWYIASEIKAITPIQVIEKK